MLFEEHVLAPYEHPPEASGWFSAGGFRFTRGEEGCPASQEPRIIITPGYAFGFDHPATHLAIETLSGLSAYFKGQRVLDIGAGSGILSIYLVRKGAGKVSGTEIDPVAVAEAQRNFRRNGIRRSRACCRLKDPASLRKQYPFIVANVPLNVHELVAADLRRLLRKGGVFLAGGIMCSQREKAYAVYKDFQQAGIVEKAGWVAITCINK